VGARRQAAQQRLEEFAQLLELVAVGQRAGIEHQRLGLGPRPATQAGDCRLSSLKL
jgi:hypothetical protein